MRFELDHEWRDSAPMKQVFGFAADVALRPTDDVDRNAATDLTWSED